MKKRYIVLIVVVVVALAGGAAYVAYDRGVFGQAAGAVAQAVPIGSDQVPATRLALGTLSLEGTDLAVTQEQAAELLPLWQMYSALAGSSTSADEEVSAVESQLRDAMTEAQMEAIRGTGSSPEQMAELMESLGVDTTRMPATEGTAAAFSGSGQFQIPSGGTMPQGGFGGGQGGGNFSGVGDFAAGGMTMPDMGGTTDDSGDSTATQRRGAMGGVNTAVLQMLIQVLQERAAGPAS